MRIFTPQEWRLIQIEADRNVKDKKITSNGDLVTVNLGPLMLQAILEEGSSRSVNKKTTKEDLDLLFAQLMIDRIEKIKAKNTKNKKAIQSDGDVLLSMIASARKDKRIEDKKSRFSSLKSALNTHFKDLFGTKIQKGNSKAIPATTNDGA